MRKLTLNGETLSVKEWSKRTGLGVACLYRRMEKSPFPEVVLKTPRRHGHAPKVYEYKGKSLTMKQLSDLSGLSPQCINGRLRLGWDLERALNTPVIERPDWSAPPIEQKRAVGLKFSYSL